MKNIIKRTELAINSHVVRDGNNIAYAIFTGYSEYYSAMIAGTWNGRVVRISRDNLESWSDEDLLEVGKAVGFSFDSDKNTKIIRKGYKVQ
jgi:hypothetical protein